MNSTEEYIAWLKSGKTFQDVRNDLAQKGLAEDDISRYIRLLDNKLTKEATTKEATHHTRAQFYIGLVICVLGLVITGYTYLFGRGGYFLAYGAILGGAAIMFSGKRKM